MIKVNSFIPTLNRVLIKRILPAMTTKSGIILSQRIIDESGRLGKVVAVGRGKVSETGKLIKPLVNLGDIVMLPTYGGSKVPIKDDSDPKGEFVLCNDFDIPCVVKKYNH